MATGSPYAAQPPISPQPTSNTKTILIVVLGAVLLSVLLCGGLLALLLLPAVTAARHAAREMQSSNNLRQIGLALHHYHDVYGSLPPAYSTDADGQPLLSWRVALLPFVDQGPLYDQFHLDEAWDSPHNRALADQIPPLYRSPSAGASIPENAANYFTIREPGSAFPGADPIAFDQVADGLNNTIAVVGISTTGIPWSKPDDLTADAAHTALSQLTSADSGQILTLDAAVQRAPQMDRQQFLEMVSRDDSQQP